MSKDDFEVIDVLLGQELVGAGLRFQKQGIKRPRCAVMRLEVKVGAGRWVQVRGKQIVGKRETGQGRG